MRCAFCHHGRTDVYDSRSAEDNASVRRRRKCANPDCGLRFTTYERVHLRDLIVVKKAGEKEPFDREKLIRSMKIALRKRPVDEDRMERTVNSIQRLLETSAENEIPSQAIGEMLMERLRGLDKVGYIRFASVYRNFREARDFENFLGRLEG